MNNNNHNCLPFVTRLSEQHNRLNYTYGQVCPLYSPTDRLLSFQLRRTHLASSTWSVKCISMTDGSEIDLTGDVLANGWQVVSGTGYDTIVYCPLMGWSSLRIPIGQHYVRLTDGTNIWYSEVFTCVELLTDYIRLDWSNVYDLPLNDGADGAIIYENIMPYTNTLYFAAELGKPEYPFEEEGENRDGYFFAEKQVSSKTYKFSIIAPEYMCDCLRLVRMGDYIKVRDGYGNEYKCDTFLATPQWQENGDVALVSIEFTTGTVVKHIGLGFHSNGDFNKDFNNDYNIN